MKFFNREIHELRENNFATGALQIEVRGSMRLKGAPASSPALRGRCPARVRFWFNPPAIQFARPKPTRTSALQLPTR